MRGVLVIISGGASAHVRATHPSIAAAFMFPGLREGLLLLEAGVIFMGFVMSRRGLVIAGMVDFFVLRIWML